MIFKDIGPNFGSKSPKTFSTMHFCGGGTPNYPSSSS